MVKRTGPTNEHLQSLITDLKKKSFVEKVKLWKRIALDLSRPARQRRAVNLFHLNKHADEKETLLVPGKVLGTGNIDKKITVVAYNFSQSALNKIKEVGGNAISIRNLMEKNPKGNKVRIIG